MPVGSPRPTPTTGARWHRSRPRSFRPATLRAGHQSDSFDSRYAASGLVRADQVIGRAVPLF
ncbi:MAG: S26 family signal peptidase [Zoogloeaceae bacterium]|nr:S26 family signal peptidase [Zoogloeaceae bacterium]